MSMQIVECTLARQRPRGDTNTTSPSGQAPPGAAGRVPRIARLMALALRFEQLVRSGAVRDYAELARFGQASRARLTQIMSLLHLAPDLQEKILFLPRGHCPSAGGAASASFNTQLQSCSRTRRL